MSLRDLPTDETALVRLAASCSNEAFTAIIERFSRHLRLLVTRYADLHEDRDDLRADIVAKLLDDRKRALRTWQPTAPFIAYLTTIATRHCLQWIRRHRRLDSMTLLQLTGPGEGERDIFDEIAQGRAADDPSTALQSAESRTLVREALGQLSADDRLILALRFEEGLNGPAIARALGISDGAARKRLFTALRRVERCLGELAPDVFVG